MNNLCHLTHLKLNCISNISFHRSISLLSSVFGQLTYFSLKLKAYTSISGPFIVSGDTIEELCLCRLKSSSSYGLDLMIYAEEDLKDKIIFNSFVKSFSGRKSPSVIILEDLYHSSYRKEHEFIVYTLPYSGRLIRMSYVPKDSYLYVESSRFKKTDLIFMYLYLEVHQRQMLGNSYFHTYLSC